MDPNLVLSAIKKITPSNFNSIKEVADFIVEKTALDRLAKGYMADEPGQYDPGTPEGMGEALAFAPTPIMAGATAIKGVKGLSNIAKGGKIASMAEDLADNAGNAMKKLFHGTAGGNDFDKFDLNKAGTGVGQNMIDQGDQIYLTEIPEAAEYFADLANQRKMLSEGRIPDLNKGSVLEFSLSPDAKILELDEMPRGNEQAVKKIINQAKGDGFDAIRFIDKGFETVEGSKKVADIYGKLGRAPKTTIVLNQDILNRNH